MSPALAGGSLPLSHQGIPAITKDYNIGMSSKGEEVGSEELGDRDWYMYTIDTMHKIDN